MTEQWYAGHSIRRKRKDKRSNITVRRGSKTAAEGNTLALADGQFTGHKRTM